MFLNICHGIGFLKNTGRDIQSFVKLETSRTAIQALREPFVIHSIPDRIISGNGAPLQYRFLSRVCNQIYLEHTTSSTLPFAWVYLGEPAARTPNSILRENDDIYNLCSNVQPKERHRVKMKILINKNGSSASSSGIVLLYSQHSPGILLQLNSQHSPGIHVWVRDRDCHGCILRKTEQLQHQFRTSSQPIYFGSHH